MPTYCQPADCELYTEGLEVNDVDAFERLIGRAEHDIDAQLPPAPLVPATGLKVDVDAVGINPDWVTALNRATCAQVEYRIEMGEAFFARHQYAVTEGPEFTLTGQVPYIGPKVTQELVAAGWIQEPGTGLWRGVPWV
jgi:hypothetical protein